MRETIREEGVWWLPRAPKATRSFRTLVADADGVRLEAVIAPVAGVVHGALVYPQVIVGRTPKCRLYTCPSTYYTNRTTSHAVGGTLEIAKLDAVNVLKGQHYKKASDAAFKEGAWCYSNLQLWFPDDLPMVFKEETDETVLEQCSATAGILCLLLLIEQIEAEI